MYIYSRLGKCHFNDEVVYYSYNRECWSFGRLSRLHDDNTRLEVLRLNYDNEVVGFDLLFQDDFVLVKE